MKINTEFDNMYKIVARNISKYRKLKNISLNDLSKYTKILENYLKELENSEDNIIISIYDLYKISTVLDISIEKFFEQ